LYHLQKELKHYSFIPVVKLFKNTIGKPQTHADITQTKHSFCLGDLCPGKRIMPFRHNRW